MNTIINYSIVAILSFILSLYGARAGIMLGQLRLPLLIYFSPNPICGIATNLAISALGSLTGSVNCMRMKLVDIPLLAKIGIPSAAGGILSFRIGTGLNPSYLEGIVSIIIILCGWEMYFRAKLKNMDAVERERERGIVPFALTGFGLGLASGITGIMLGSIRLPFMIRFLKVSVAKASATNMLIGSLTGICASLSAVGLGKIDFLMLLIIAPPTALGAYLGTLWIKKSESEQIYRQIGILILIAGFVMFARVISVLFHIHF